MALVNTFLSYLLLLVIFAAAIGVAVALGIHFRKKKNAEEEAAKGTENL